MYWFSLKTPLRDGRSATHPCAPRTAAAIAATPNKARIGLVLRIVSSPEDFRRRRLLRLRQEAGVEDRGITDAARTAAGTGIDAHEHAVGRRRDVVGVVVI